MAVRAPIAVLAVIGAVAACDSFAATEVGGDASAADASASIDATSTDGGAIDADASLIRSASYEALVKSHAPAAFWRFAEGGGTKATSITGDLDELVVPANGPAWSPTGVFGGDSRSLRFLSSSSTAVAENAPGTVKQVGPGDFALELWLELPIADAEERWLVRQTGASTSYGVFVDSTGITAENILASGQVETVFAAQQAGPGWHHIVMSRAGSPFTLWVDAKKYEAPQGVDGSPTSFTAAFVVGGQTQSTKLLPAEARIAEVAIYDRGLTPAEVAEHHAAGKP